MKYHLFLIIYRTRALFNILQMDRHLPFPNESAFHGSRSRSKLLGKFSSHNGQRGIGNGLLHSFHQNDRLNNFQNRKRMHLSNSQSHWKLNDDKRITRYFDDTIQSSLGKQYISKLTNEVFPNVQRSRHQFDFKDKFDNSGTEKYSNGASVTSKVGSSARPTNIIGKLGNPLIFKL